MTRLICLYAILFYLGAEVAITLREIRERDPAGRLPAPAASTTTRGGTQNRLPETRNDQTPFLGVTVELEQYDDPLQRREALRRLSAAGFGWARLHVDWNRAEPISGAYQWAWTDDVLADISAAGLEPVVVLDGSDPSGEWLGNAAGKRVVDRDERPLSTSVRHCFSPFARFAAAFADRYQDTVRFYQIWDEPNIAPRWGNRLIDPVGYARLLRAAATAVRAADPDAVILAAALAPTQDRGHTAIDEGYFLQRLYAAGAAPYFDAVLVQPFGFGTGPDDARSRVDVLNFRRAAWARRVMVAAGDGQTPVWAVRFGWNRQTQAQWKTVSPANQLRFTREAIRHARANWPWMTAMGWPVDRPDAPPSDPMWGFALFTAEGQDHPLIAALTAGTSEERTVDSQRDEAPSAPWNAFWSTLRHYPRSTILYPLLFSVLLWRGAVIARGLPLARWQAAYRRWPQLGKLAVWALLLVIYHLASWPPLIVLCWLVAAFLIAAQPLTGLMIAAAALPFHFQHKELRLVGAVWVAPPAQAALLCTLPALVQHTAARIRALRPKLRTGDWLVLTWVGVSLLTALNVWHWPGYVHGFRELVAAPVLLYAGVRLFAAAPRQQRAVLYALFAGGLLAAGLGLVDWLLSSGGVSVDGVRRLMGVSFSPNQTALYLLRTLFVGVGLLAHLGGEWRVQSRRFFPRSTPRYPLTFCCLLVAAALALTISRGAIFLGLPAGALVMAAAGRRLSPAHDRLRRWLPLIGLLTLAVGLALIPLYGERVLNVETLRIRLAIWRDAWSLWRQFPLLGVGPGGFFWNYPAFLQPSPAADPNLLHPHSLWLEYATGWGAAGLVWLGALLGWLLSTLSFHLSVFRPKSSGEAVANAEEKRAPRAWLQTGLLAALCAGLAHAQVDAFAALPELAAWNFAALALLGAPGSDSA